VGKTCKIPCTGTLAAQLRLRSVPPHAAPQLQTPHESAQEKVMKEGFLWHSPMLAQWGQCTFLSRHGTRAVVVGAGVVVDGGVVVGGVVVGGVVVGGVVVDNSQAPHERAQEESMKAGFFWHSPIFAHPAQWGCLSRQGPGAAVGVRTRQLHGGLTTSCSCIPGVQWPVGRHMA